MGPSTKRLFATIALAAGLWLAGCSRSSESLFGEAQQALAADDAERAARLFKEITIASPDDPLAARAHYELAQMYYLRLRSVTASRDSLIKILTDYPASPVVAPARKMLARLYERELDSPEKALAQYEILIRQDPDIESEREMLSAVADCHYRLDELDASRDAYQRVLSLPYHPDTDAAYLRLATLEWIAARPEESLRLLRELRDRSASEDRRYEAVVGEIDLLTRLGRFAEAREEIDFARRVFPGRPDLEELQRWVQAAYRRQQSLDSDGPALEERQKTIRWGSGRRRRASPSPKEPS